ncbi:hypothetical protein J2Z58_003956 [Halobacillus andaensis]|nr:hypothetical protein [Halobacillus andaensis]
MGPVEMSVYYFLSSYGVCSMVPGTGKLNVTQEAKYVFRYLVPRYTLFS